MLLKRASTYYICASLEKGGHVGLLWPVSWQMSQQGVCVNGMGDEKLGVSLVLFVWKLVMLMKNIGEDRDQVRLSCVEVINVSVFPLFIEAWFQYFFWNDLPGLLPLAFLLASLDSFFMQKNNLCEN